MKVYIRRNSRNYGDPGLLMPCLATIWFRAEEDEPTALARLLAMRFAQSCLKDLGMSTEMLGKTHGYRTNNDATSFGVQFSHEKYAEKARAWVDEWLYNRGEYSNAWRDIVRGRRRIHQHLSEQEDQFRIRNRHQ